MRKVMKKLAQLSPARQCTDKDRSKQRIDPAKKEPSNYYPVTFLMSAVLDLMENSVILCFLTGIVIAKTSRRGRHEFCR